jgi:hypothetical protein
MAVFHVGFKIQVAPAVALSAPGKGASAYLMAAGPYKCFILGLYIGAFLFVYIKMLISLVYRVVAPGKPVPLPFLERQ